MPHSTRTHARIARLLILAVALYFAALLATAGQFAIQPMRLELGGSIRSSALTLRNDDTAALSFQVRGMDWTQDGEGQDHYQDATDLIYFPRLLTVEPGQEAVIRVGLRQNLVSQEKTYRLFIEEQPRAAPPPASRAPLIRVMVRFGAPIFVKPVNPTRQLELQDFTLQSGQAHWTLRNAGNQHELFEHIELRGLDAAGQTVFATPLNERYFLAGRTRHFTVPVPAADCARLAKLALDIKTEQSSVRREIDLGPPSCP